VGLPQCSERQLKDIDPDYYISKVVEASSTNSTNNGRNNMLGCEDSKELVPSGFAKAANLLSSGFVHERVVLVTNHRACGSYSPSFCTLALRACTLAVHYKPQGFWPTPSSFSKLRSNGQVFSPYKLLTTRFVAHTHVHLLASWLYRTCKPAVP
jgi:hypothetical protein